MVRSGKLSKVPRMASMYMEEKIVPCRIDVVAIVLDENFKNILPLTLINIY